MKFLISLAWKNLSRYRRRTIITVVAIAVGIGMYIGIDGMLLGAEKETELNLIRYETGSARIMDATYWQEHDYLLPKYHIRGYRSIQDKLSALGYASTPRITILGELGRLEAGDNRLPGKISGIDVETDGQVFALAGSIEPGDGRYLQPDAPEMIIGKEFAESLHINLNDEVLIVTKTATGAYETLDVVVVGFLSTPDPLVNKGEAFIPLSYLQHRLFMTDACTDIVVAFPDWLDPEKEKSKITAGLATLDGAEDWVVLHFNDLASEFLTIASTKRAGTKMILFLIFLIAAIGISNTMLMAVFERMKEIGMMRALGMKDTLVMRAFFLEALGIGFIGAVAGTMLGVLINLYMVNVGIDFTAYIKDMGNIGYRMAGVMRSMWNPETILTAFFSGMLFSGFIALFPARRALKMQITDCLRDK